ncbi:MAG: hypothetical protein K9J85_01375 [Desulfobacteraceae bacterium]|nr:hypothetical protein [Desulfobacteraceae bacterium]
MSRDTEFQLFGLIPEEGQEAEARLKGGEDSESSDSFNQGMVFRIEKSYFVIVLFALYVVLSWLFGFYISTFVIAVSYLSLYGKASLNPTRSLFYKCLLVLVLLGSVYIFDFSFGHNFMEGKVFEYFQILGQ